MSCTNEFLRIHLCKADKIGLSKRFSAFRQTTIIIIQVRGSTLPTKISEILKADPYLVPFKRDIEQRAELLSSKKKQLLKNEEDIVTFASGYEYFGFHQTQNGWVYREWAPAAEAVYLTGDFNGWNETSHEMQRVEPTTMGVYELFVPEIGEGTLYKYLIIAQDGTKHYKADPYATYAQMRPETASIVADISKFKWSDSTWMKNRAAKKDEEVVIDPKTDLICLCPNCHRMVHRYKDKVLTLEELKGILSKL